MILCSVSGTIVASSNSDRTAAPRFLIVKPCGTDGTTGEAHMVALDSVGAGYGEVVIVAQGSSCRQIPETDGAAVDALIVGIVDSVSENDREVYRKDRP